MAAPVEIWVNPACTTCRVARAELEAAGVGYVERRYLDEAPSTTELAEVLDRMALEPWDLARPKEAREEGIDLPRDADHREEWLAALVAHPRAIQRPIITLADGTTEVARDPGTLARLVAAAQEQGS